MIDDMADNRNLKLDKIYNVTALKYTYTLAVQYLQEKSLEDAEDEALMTCLSRKHLNIQRTGASTLPMPTLLIQCHQVSQKCTTKIQHVE